MGYVTRKEGSHVPRIKGVVVIIDVRLPRQLLEEFDDWWKREGFVSRAEAIRQALREIMKMRPLAEISAMASNDVL